MSAYRAKPPMGSRLNPGDPLAEGLTGAWLFAEGSGLTVRSAMGGSAAAGTLTGGPTWDSSSYGKVISCTAITHYIGGLGFTDLLLPVATGSIVLVQRKRDTTNRASSAFGATLTTTAKRVNCHTPYSDGNVYFDWAGTTNNTTRLTVSGLTFDTLPHVWVFTVGGGLGMRAYRDGLLIGSNAGTPTRTADATNVLDANRSLAASTNGDLADFGMFATYNRALSAADARALAADPFRMFRRRYVPVPLHAAAAAAGGGASDNLLLLGCG